MMTWAAIKSGKNQNKNSKNILHHNKRFGRIIVD
jgi:hypothetical protein